MIDPKRIRLVYYTISALVSFTLSLEGPVWMLRLTGAGYSLRTASMITAANAAAILLMEVPTGVVADRYGRRLSVLLCFALSAAGSALWALSTHLPLLLLGTLLSATGAALYSGAFSAWAVDALAAAGEPSSATELFGRASGISRAVSVVAGFVSGAVLSRFGMAWPYLASAAFWVALLAVSHRFMAERWARPEKRSVLGEWRIMVGSVGTVLGEARRNPALGLLLLAPVPFFIGGSAPVSQWQVRFQELAGGQSGITGYVWAAMLAVSAAVSFAIPRLVRAAGSHPRFLAAAAAVNALAIAGVALSGRLWAAIPLFCVHVAATSVTHTVCAAAVSDRVGSDVRATALSVLSMSDNLSGTVGALLFGQMATLLSMRASWLTAAAMVALTAPLMLRQRRTGRTAGLAGAPACVASARHSRSMGSS